MKKKIGIDQLEVGMYMEAGVEESVAKGASKQNVLLLGKGVLITSANQIRRLKAAGLGDVTIDTTKGKDSDGGTDVPQVEIPQPKESAKESPPPRDVRWPTRMSSRLPEKPRPLSLRRSREPWRVPLLVGRWTGRSWMWRGN